MSVSLCVINRNDSANLARLVRAARKHVSEIVVVDTGSTDDSVSSARAAGADVVREAPELLECGELLSFSRARALSYELSTCQWQFWLDTDDDLSDWDALARAIDVAERARDAFGRGISIRMWYDYSWNDDRSECTQSFSRERITHRDDGWEWKRPVHEYLETNGQSRDVLVNSPRVVHLSQGARGVANDRNLRILQRWLRDGGDAEDPTALFYYLGDEMLARDRFGEAVEFFDRVPEGNWWYERAQFRAIRALVGERSLFDAGDRADALIKKFPDVADFRWEMSRIMLALGYRDEAKGMLLSANGCRQITGENDLLARALIEVLGLA